MKLVVAGIVLTVVLAGCTTLDVGGPATSTTTQNHPGWQDSLRGNDAYVVVRGQVNPSGEYTKTDFCRDNPLSRYFARDRNSSVFAGVNGVGSTPVMSMAVADSQSICTKQFNILYFTPYFVLPDSPLSGTPQISFHLVNVDKSQLNLQQAVTDASAVAGLVAPGAHAIATLTAISQGGGVTKAQQAIDAAVNGSKNTQGTIDITLPAVKAQTQWTVPIVARSPLFKPTHFADAEFDLTVLPSRFTTLSSNEDPRSFDFSRQNRDAFTSVTTFDATSKAGCGTPTCSVRIGDFIIAHFPGGSAAYKAAVDPIEHQDGGVDKLEFFCRELGLVFNAPDGLGLTHNDRTLVIWAVLSGFTVWTSGSGTFTQSGNACLSPADYDYLKAVKLTLPTFPQSAA